MEYRHGKAGQVYCLHDVEHNICRIGKTDSRNQSRQKQQVAYYPFELIVHNEEVENSIWFEAYIHKYFNSKKKKADWYYISPKDFKMAIIEARIKYSDVAKEHKEWEEKIQEQYSQDIQVAKRKKIGRLVHDGNNWVFERY